MSSHGQVNQGNGTAQENPQEGNVSWAGNAGNGTHVNPTPAGENIPVSTSVGSINHPSSEDPAGRDREELDELIRLQYGNMGTHGRA